MSEFRTSVGSNSSDGHNMPHLFSMSINFKRFNSLVINVRRS